MRFHSAHLDAPERLSLAEACFCARLGLRRIREVRAAVRGRRLRRLPETCCGRRAAWGLVVSPHTIKELVASGRLPARLIEGPRFRHYEIRREDVLAAAEALRRPPGEPR